MKKIVWLLAVVCALGLPAAAAAQAQGSVSVTVTDTSGGVLPGVTVTLKSAAGAVKTGVTDATGSYTFENVAPGAYEVAFELLGFSRQTMPVTVVAGQPATVSTKLQIGGRTETVQVTGTLIPRPTLEAMSPVTTLEVEELTYRGINRVEDLLTSLPQVFVAQNSSVSNGASGTATVDLRYLGTNRTLVLIDGRRMSAGDAFATAPDLNFIPSALVKRVDVLTGGASSTYGADAVAGVVNFVLDTDFTGFRGGVEYSTFQHNNNSALAQQINAAKGFEVPTGSLWNDGPANFNIAFGSRLNEGKGHASLYLDYRTTDAITKDLRDYTNCSVATLTSSPSCGGSSTIPAGRFIDPAGDSWVLDLNSPNGDQLRPRTSSDVYNFAPKNFMQRPDKRWAGGAFLNYDVNNYVTLYGDVMFMDDTTDAQIAESGDFANTGEIDCRNPLMSEQQYQTLCAAHGYNRTDNFLAPVILMKRNVEGGGRVSHLNHTDLRFTGGLRGDINKNWGWDVYALQATVRSPQSYSNDLNASRLQNALNIGPDGQCTSDLANGCVPWNVWKKGAITRDQLDYLALDMVLDSGTRTRVLNGTLKGDLKDRGLVSPAAIEGVKLAFGGTYRSEYLFVNADYPFQEALGAGQGGPTQSIEGDYNVKEFFAEGLLPLVQDHTFAKDLSLELGYRLSDYSSTGRWPTYKVQTSWSPVPDLKVRFGYNRATRSPNINELYAPQGIGLGGSSDPCAGPTPAYSPAQCALTGVPVSRYGTVLDNPATQYNTLGGGNPDLKPEVANTWTAGVVLTPRSVLPGFTATFDWYDVKIEDTIGALGSNDILNTCATTGKLCDLIHRDALYTTWLTPNGYVLTTGQNIGKLRSSGVDITGSYTRPLPGGLGALSVNLIGTYLLKSFIDTGLYGYDCVGYFGNTCGVPSSTWRHLTRFSWETPWRLTVTAGWRRLGGVTEDSGSDNQYLANPVRFAELQQNGYYAAKIPAFDWMDLGASFRIHKGVTFLAGVNNVFDTEPPIGIGSQPNDYGTGFYGMYDALGRFVHTGVQFTF